MECYVDRRNEIKDCSQGDLGGPLDQSLLRFICFIAADLMAVGKRSVN
jgi:hypothetical protein